jgi:hypothetical protein
MTRRWIALAILPLGLGGCGSLAPRSSSPPLGRTLAVEAAPATSANALSGDPPAERDGSVPAGLAVKENAPAADALSGSPRAALERYALAYTNWRAASLPARERQLAALAVGAARLTAEQTAAAGGDAAVLATDHVQNTGVVLAIAPAQGPAHGMWVVVTQEQSTGTVPYAGLPAAPHVTLARLERLHHGWVIADWSPES